MDLELEDHIVIIEDKFNYNMKSVNQKGVIKGVLPDDKLYMICTEDDIEGWGNKPLGIPCGHGITCYRDELMLVKKGDK